MSFNVPPFLLRPLRTPLLAVAIPVALGAWSVVRSGAAEIVDNPASWFHRQQGPPFESPKKTFGIASTTFYAGMGYASYLAIKTHDSTWNPVVRRLAYSGLGLYYAQLAMNLAWTPLFFGMRQKFLAMVDLVALTGTSIVMTRDLHDATNGATTWYLAPYVAWLSYATYLNAGYWWLNRNRPDTY